MVITLILLILQQGYQHHRQLILYMVNTCCIPTTNKINKLKGLNHFVNPYFPIESHTTNIDSMSDDTSSNNDDDNVMITIILNQMKTLRIMITLRMMILKFNHRWSQLSLYLFQHLLHDLFLFLVVFFNQFLFQVLFIH
jgi:hypothetical protein